MIVDLTHNNENRKCSVGLYSKKNYSCIYMYIPTYMHDLIHCTSLYIHHSIYIAVSTIILPLTVCPQRKVKTILV